MDCAISMSEGTGRFSLRVRLALVGELRTLRFLLGTREGVFDFFPINRVVFLFIFTAVYESRQYPSQISEEGEVRGKLGSQVHVLDFFRGSPV